MNTSNGIHGIPTEDLVFLWESAAPGKRIFLDKGWSEFLGHASDGARQRPLEFSNWKQSIHLADLPRIERTLESHWASHRPYCVEFRILKRDGTTSWVWDVGSPRIDEQGTFTGFVGHFLVVDAVKMAQFTATVEIQRRDQQLAILSHELRNPLAAIIHSVDYGNESNQLPDGLKKVWRIIDRQANHMSKLLDDLLDVVRVTQNKFEFDKRAIDLREIVADVVETTMVVSSRQGVELKMVDAEEPLLVMGDPNRIHQVVVNLLDNAIKYTPVGGSVTVELAQRDQNAVVSVCDTGKGIQASELDRIFELYFQEPRSDGSVDGGLGIGLFLVRQLAELHGGTIEAFSDGPGKGCRFVFSLPLTQRNSIDEANKRASTVRGR